MEANKFDEVLRNPLWTKQPHPLNKKLTNYRFDVYNKDGVIVYVVNPETRMVAATSFPKDMANFRPGLLSFEDAWATWFAPWCKDKGFVNFCRKLQHEENGWIGNTQELTMATSFVSLSNEYVTMMVYLEPSGDVKYATLERFYFHHPPGEDNVPVIKEGSLAEISALFEELDAEAKDFQIT